MNDNREDYTRLRRGMEPVHERVIEDLYTHAPSTRRPGTLPAVGLVALTALLVVTATLLLSRAGRVTTSARPNAAESTAATRGAPTGAIAAGVATARPTRVLDGAVSTAGRTSQTEPLPSGVIALNLQGSLYVMNPDGSGRTALLRDYDPNRGPSGFAWSPDGTRIAFSDIEEQRNEFGGFSSDILVINADGSGLTRLTGPPHGEGSPSWSPDGRRILYTQSVNENSAEYRADIWIMNADGTEKRVLAENAGGAAWSPDGKQIAFVVENRGIHVMKPDGTGRARLPETRNDDGLPVWSPDGTRIAFRRGKPGAPGGIYVMDAGGRGATRLTDIGYTFSPSWSPDGSHITFAREGSIYIIRSDGSDERLLVGGGVASSPSWSPAGATVSAYAGPTPKPAPTATRSELATQYLQVDGITYTSAIGSEARSALKEVYTTVRRKIDLDAGQEGRLRDGDSTLHAAGAKLYRMKGYQPTYKLAADDPDKEGQILWYTAQPNPQHKTGSDLFDVREVYAITVATWKDPTNHDNGSLTGGAILDPSKVAEMLDMVRRAPVNWSASDPQKYESVSLWLRDGRHNDFSVGGPNELPLHLLQLPSEFWDMLDEALRSDRQFELTEEGLKEVQSR